MATSLYDGMTDEIALEAGVRKANELQKRTAQKNVDLYSGAAGLGGGWPFAEGQQAAGGWDPDLYKGHWLNKGAA